MGRGKTGEDGQQESERERKIEEEGVGEGEGEGEKQNAREEGRKTERARLQERNSATARTNTKSWAGSVAQVVWCQGQWFGVWGWRGGERRRGRRGKKINRKKE